MQIEAIKKLFKGVDTRTDWYQQPNRREKIVFFVAVFIFIIAFFKACWGPSGLAITEMKTDLAAVTEQNKYLQQVVSATSDTEKQSFQQDALKQVQYSGWAQKFAQESDTLLIGNFSNPNMLRDIKMGNVSLQETDTPGGLIKKTFKVSLYGSFTSIGGYLVKMEALPMLLSVENLKIQSTQSTNEASKAKVNVDMEGVVYGWK